jgi:hypothetical protein
VLMPPGWRLVVSALLALVTFGMLAMVLAGAAHRRAAPRRGAVRPVPGLAHTPGPVMGPARTSAGPAG